MIPFKPEMLFSRSADVHRRVDGKAEDDPAAGDHHRLERQRADLRQRAVPSHRTGGKIGFRLSSKLTSWSGSS